MSINTRKLYTRKEELEQLQTEISEAVESLHEKLAEIEEHAKSEPGDDASEEEKEEWQEAQEELQDALEEARDALEEAREALGEGELQELEELMELEGELGWRAMRDGANLIEDMEQEARSVAEDCSGLDLSQWPLTCIDWERAARELVIDYAVITYQGADYYFRE